MTVEEFLTRWPTAGKHELTEGILVSTPRDEPYDERDVETAQRCYPDARVVLDGGCIEVHPL